MALKLLWLRKDQNLTLKVSLVSVGCFFFFLPISNDEFVWFFNLSHTRLYLYEHSGL